MISLPITSIIAATLAMIMLVLTILISMRRVSLGKAEGDAGKYPIHDGDDEHLKRRISAFTNFIEYVPVALLLLALIELQGATSVLIWGLGVAFVIGRILHAIGMLSNPHFPLPRIIGMLATYAVLLIPAGWLILH